MDPFEEFESANNKATSDDPAAEFLAREQAELDKIENDDFFSSPPVATTNSEQQSEDPFGMGDNTANIESKGNEPEAKVSRKLCFMKLVWINI
jgi:hypothetical protein